jgi:glycosyltransferase involved in cell wall biosynthesis
MSTAITRTEESATGLRPQETAPTTSLTVLVPVYNEEHLVATSLDRLRVLESNPDLDRIEVIVVDDCSTDGTPDVLQLFAERTAAAGGRIAWTFRRHERNQGKGGAIRTALALASCELTVIHDADLEYHPKDLASIVRVFLDEDADAVFGSRFAGSAYRRVLLFRHELGNKLLTFLCNLATNLNLTDMETCYKAVRTSLLQSIPLVSDDFRLEPELTIKLAKREARIFEVPISYAGRTYQEGKKINWKDGVAALWAIVRFALSDDVYREDAPGAAMLARLRRAPRFNAWMADVVRPYCGNRVLEIGAGIGNLTQQLIPRKRYVATDLDPLHVATLRTLRRDRPYLVASRCDVTDSLSFPRPADFDTVICLNVIEHIEDDRQAMANLRGALQDGGRAIVLVPYGQWNFGTLDTAVGHFRRYGRDDFRRLAEAAGFQVETVLSFNRFGTVGWLLNGRILRRRNFSLLQVKALNLLTPIFRMVDRVVPLPPLSIIGILRRAPAAP